MFHNWWTPKSLVLALAIVVLACVAGALATAVVQPEPVSRAALGPDWQCSRVAFVWTTCRRMSHVRPPSVRLASETACKRTRT